jgi:hypothetical protein
MLERRRFLEQGMAPAAAACAGWACVRKNSIGRHDEWRTLIRARGLGLQYGSKRVLDGLDFEIPPAASSACWATAPARPA